MVNFSKGISGAVSGASAGSSFGLSGAAIGAVIGGTVGLFSKDSAAEAAKRQYNYQRLLNQQQYDLTQQGYRESPTNQRLGLEAAGYNPILALGGGGMSYGSYSAGSASAPMDSTTSDLGNMATNAYQTFKLAREKNNADIAGIMAGIKNTNADTALKFQYAATEEAKRIQMDFQNAKIEAETKLTQKDLDTYDRRFYQFIAESASRIERNSVLNAVNQMDAQTNAQNAATNAYDAETRRLHHNGTPEAFMADFRENHPHLYGAYMHTNNAVDLANKIFKNSDTTTTSYNTNPVTGEVKNVKTTHTKKRRRQ